MSISGATRHFLLQLRMNSLVQVANNYLNIYFSFLIDFYYVLLLIYPRSRDEYSLEFMYHASFMIHHPRIHQVFDASIFTIALSDPCRIYHATMLESKVFFLVD